MNEWSLHIVHPPPHTYWSIGGVCWNRRSTERPSDRLSIASAQWSIIFAVPFKFAYQSKIYMTVKLPISLSLCLLAISFALAIAAMQIAQCVCLCLCVSVRAHTFASGLYANPGKGGWKGKGKARNGSGEKEMGLPYTYICTPKRSHTHSRTTVKKANAKQAEFFLPLSRGPFAQTSVLWCNYS